MTNGVIIIHARPDGRPVYCTRDVDHAVEVARVYGDDGVMLLEYGVLTSPRSKGGWIPAFWDGGGKLWSGWDRLAYDEGDAWEMAEAMALEHRDRYVGDWQIVVRPRMDA